MTPDAAERFWNDRPSPPLNLSRQPSGLAVRGLDGVEEIRFDSTLWRGQAVRIFAYAALQPRPAACPTVIMVHGGGALAEALLNSRSVLYGPAGFNVLSLDLPGRGDRREGSRSTGPDMVYANLFWAGEDLHDAWLYHAVSAVRRAVDAAAEMGCDERRVLLDGWSWGGVVSLMAAAADPRVIAVAAVYGGGHLRHGAIGRDVERLGPPAAQRWRDAFDPAWQGFRRGQQLYLVSGTNDTFFAMPDNLDTAGTLKAPGVHVAMSPNQDHALTDEYLRSLDHWVIAAGGGEEVAWPGIDGMDGARGTARTSGPAVRVDFAFADEAPDEAEALASWPKLRWEVLPCPVRDGLAEVPADKLRGRLWYAGVVAESGLIASTPLGRSIR